MITLVALAAGREIREVLPPKLELPRYCAVMVWVPRLNDDSPNVACPPAFSVPVPIGLAPSKKFTLPVGVAPVALETIAENCTN